MYRCPILYGSSAPKCLGGVFTVQILNSPLGGTPGTGDVVRVDPSSGATQVITTGLSLPTGMTFGPDGKLYVSNVGFGPSVVVVARYCKSVLNVMR